MSGLGNCSCGCGVLNETATVRMESTKWGFPPFHAQVDANYTVGSGWDFTAITTGMIAVRWSGNITGIYEAKGSFTASADPATDTTNWRHAGPTATAGESNYWWNCDPILKWTIRAIYTVGAGWGYADSLGFGGNRADPPVAWALVEGDLVARQTQQGVLSFYRCRNPGEWGDPASDAVNFYPYQGNRSLWLDFTAPSNPAYSAPFDVHRTPTTRYTTWTETTNVWIDEVLTATYTREFSRDNLTGIITNDQDDWSPGNLSLGTIPTVTNPARPAPPDPSTIPPLGPCPLISTGVDTAQAIGSPFAEDYIVPVVSSLPIRNLMHPSEPSFTDYDSQSFAPHPYSFGWPVPSYYDGLDTFSTPAVSGAFTRRFDLTGLDITSTETIFEYEYNVPWYWEIELNRQYYAYWAGQAADTDGDGCADLPVSWEVFLGYSTVNSQTLHTKNVRVAHVITLSNEITQAAHVTAAAAELPAFPAAGYETHVTFDNAGTVTESLYYRNYVEPWVNLYYNSTQSFTGVTDTRLNENQVRLFKLSAIMATAHHWTQTWTQGGSAAETEYFVAGTHSFNPSGTSLDAARATTTDPSP